MNINDIAEFMDLVKNPAKYDAYLKKIQDEQDRLIAVVETVGKASELDKLRKQTEATAAKQQKEFDVKSAELTANIEKAAADIDAKTTKLRADLTAAAEALAEAKQKQDTANKLTLELTQKQKELQSFDTSLTAKATALAEQERDLQEKTQKLKQIMG